MTLFGIIWVQRYYTSTSSLLLGISKPWKCTFIYALLVGEDWVHVCICVYTAVPTDAGSLCSWIICDCFRKLRLVLVGHKREKPVKAFWISVNVWMPCSLSGLKGMVRYLGALCFFTVENLGVSVDRQKAEVDGSRSAQQIDRRHSAHVSAVSPVCFSKWTRQTGRCCVSQNAKLNATAEDGSLNLLVKRNQQNICL